MKPFDPLLKSQHSSIMEALKNFEISWLNRDEAECKKTLLTLHQVVLQHHDIEWEQLFAKIYSHSKLNQGGPYCTYFFDSFIRNRPREKVTQILKENLNLDSADSEFRIPKSLQAVFKINSMLSVPLEEHIALQMLIEAMIKTISNWNTLNQNWFNQCLELTRDLARQNIEKEETCLWVLIHQTCPKARSE